MMASDRPSPAIAAPETECDADAGAAPERDPEVSVGSDDPGCVEPGEEGDEPGDCDPDAPGEEAAEEAGLWVGDPFCCGRGLFLAPGIPTDVSTAFTLPAVHEV